MVAGHGKASGQQKPVSTSHSSKDASGTKALKSSDPRLKWKASTDSRLFLFHICTFSVFLYAYLWIFGKKARKIRIPGYGRFSQFFSHWGFVAQLSVLLFNVLLHIMPERAHSPWYSETTDDLSCAVFGISNTVSVMSVLLSMFVTEKVKLQTPTWFNLVLHLFNSLAAWVDVLAMNRSFRKKSFELGLMYMCCYAVFLAACTSYSKKYPYAILNKMSHPEGFFVIGLLSMGVFWFTFYLGSRVNRRSRRAIALRKLKLHDVVQ